MVLAPFRQEVPARFNVENTSGRRKIMKVTVLLAGVLAGGVCAEIVAHGAK
jgi:hypothetical protein